MAQRRLVVTVTVLLLSGGLGSASADTDFDLLFFNLGSVDGTIEAAELTIRPGGFTGVDFIGDFQVNQFALQGADGDFLDLTRLMFPEGLLDQGPLGTEPVSVSLANDVGVLDWMAVGPVGIYASLTDTDDGYFAIDFMSLEVFTSTGTFMSLLGDQDYFGLGNEPGKNAPLPGPPQEVLPFENGTSIFDIALSGVTINTIPAPSALALLAVGALFPASKRCRRRQVLPI